MREKPFLTIDEQVTLLERRGLSFEDDDRITLMREGYYSLVNGYKDAFIDRQASSEAGEDRYREGISFKHLDLLFDIDRALREETFPLLVRAETTLRTALAYNFSKRYRECDSYLNPDNYCAVGQYHNRRRYEADKAKLINTLREAHDNRHMHHQSIDHYLATYGHVPLWVLVNVLTFGNISHMYALSTTQVKNDVCRMVAEVRGGGRIGSDQLQKAMFTLVDFRNVCAHDDRLYCARLGKHHDKTYADMLDALRVVIGSERVFDFETGLVRTIKQVEGVPTVRDEVLRGMGLSLEGESLVRSVER